MARRRDLPSGPIIDAIYMLIVSAAADGQAHPLDLDYARELSSEIREDVDALAEAIMDFVEQCKILAVEQRDRREES
jgi:hypothetical protein